MCSAVIKRRATVELLREQEKLVPEAFFMAAWLNEAAAEWAQ